jgi:hypothetical protein
LIKRKENIEKDLHLIKKDILQNDNDPCLHLKVIERIDLDDHLRENIEKKKSIEIIEKDHLHPEIANEVIGPDTLTEDHLLPKRKGVKD